MKTPLEGFCQQYEYVFEGITFFQLFIYRFWLTYKLLSIFFKLLSVANAFQPEGSLRVNPGGLILVPAAFAVATDLKEEVTK